MIMDIENFIFYEDLKEEEKELVRNNLKKVSFDKGVTLFYQGDTTKDILLLSEGQIRVYMQGDGVNEITLYTLDANDQCIVNTTSTINKTPTIGSAVTLTPIKGYMLSRDIVLELMFKNQSYQSYIFSLLTMRLDSIARVLESVKFKQLDERVYEWLKAQNKEEIVITHEELANVLGSTRVVISRLLKKLEKDSLVELQRGKIIVCS
jgi:CRP/FNR family transcriptional regulator